MGEAQLHLSARLRALADLVPANSVLADIGTDHAWIPADLLQRGRIQSAIALDIGAGPLARAAANLWAYPKLFLCGNPMALSP